MATKKEIEAELKKVKAENEQLKAQGNSKKVGSGTCVTHKGADYAKKIKK